jgi:oligopeptidase A
MIWEILKLRDEKAKLLGFPNFADYTIKVRMAKSGQNALSFIEGLRDRVEKQFHEDEVALKQFIFTKTGTKVTEVMPWNRNFWSNLLRKELYSFDSEVLRSYFSVDEVFKGLFTIVSTLYGVEVEEVPTFCGEPIEGAVEVYHKDVRFFNVYEKEGHKYRGSFFADLYPRELKRDGAWQTVLSFGYDGHHIGAICGNLQKPVGDKPALLDHLEVQTIFHEFGHLCHFILTDVPFASIAGTNVAYDFVELPSQFLENWTWEKSALDLFAKHVDSGQPIPDELFANMIRARNFQTGRAYMGQLGLGKLDMELHLNYAKYVGRPIEEVDLEILERYRIARSIRPPSVARSFLHLFGEPTGYGSGYYSYLWAEVLDADAFTVFQKEGVLNAEYGMKFRREILARGDAEPADVLFRNFMGRDPDLTAFLKRGGILP